MFRCIRAVAFAAGAALCIAPATGLALTTNPDISVVGQPFVRVTDAAGEASRERLVLDPGETELVFDAALNPYARGWFVIAFGDEGAEVEEAFFTIHRGLPGGLALKGGTYRLGFGKVNQTHPHAYPFGDRFRVLEAFLPGEESFRETAVQLSQRSPLWGEASLTASVDLLQGDSFRRERESSGASNDPLVTTDEGDRAEEPRPGVLGRLSGFFPLDERSGIEVGVNGAHGTNNAAAATTTTLLGADVKAKLWTGERSVLLLQGEALMLTREDAGWDEPSAAYTKTDVEPAGGYLFADYTFDPRWNAGAAYERWQSPADGETWDQAFRLFAGMKLLEETTALRLDWEHLQPGAPDGATEDPEAVNTVTLRVIFSMGPHKAHQF
jgi:hypothetical protein